GLELPNSPEHLVKLHVVAPLWRDKIFLGFEQLYISERRNLFREKNEEEFDTYTDDFFLTNITLFGERLWNNLDVSVGVYNFFDEDYSDPGGVEHFQDEIAQDGRTYRLKLTYLF
ncbi:MAG: TonB-dependent receptor, partial [Desulfobulbales bacterium]|nr:TonB-dependent receptor [Desulfobulbales bacterium]